MTNISKQKIKSADYKVIYTKLVKTIAKFNNKQATYFVDELFTETERIMFIKRFGAIFMFSQKYSPYRVAHTLGLSEPTAHRLNVLYQDGHFARLLSCMSKKETSAFLQLLNDLIAAQASPRARARILNRVL